MGVGGAKTFTCRVEALVDVASDGFSCAVDGVESAVVFRNGDVN